MNDAEKINQIKKWLAAGSINVFGKPFSGKDSQGKRLAELLGGIFITGGEILRGDNMPDRVKECMRTGELVPQEDYANIVLSHLKQPSLANKPLILSSFGRWHGEEEITMNTVQSSGHTMKAVIYLDISDEEVYERLEKLEQEQDRPNRRDDSKEAMKTRFNEFNQKTLPVIDYYHDLGLLIRINGQQSRDNVTQDIIDALFKIA